MIIKTDKTRRAVGSVRKYLDRVINNRHRRRDISYLVTFRDIISPRYRETCTKVQVIITYAENWWSENPFGFFKRWYRINMKKNFIYIYIYTIFLLSRHMFSSPSPHIIMGWWRNCINLFELTIMSNHIASFFKVLFRHEIRYFFLSINCGYAPIWK